MPVSVPPGVNLDDTYRQQSALDSTEMTVASRAVIMAVKTKARTTDVDPELKGHTILTDVGQAGHIVASVVEQEGHTSHWVGSNVSNVGRAAVTGDNWPMIIEPS